MITAAELKVRVTSDTAQAEQGIERTNRGVSGLGAAAAAAGAKMSLGLTVPLVGLGTQAVRTAMNFESSMNRVAALTGATDEQMADLTSTARELGRSTQYSASQSADAMGFLAMAGFQTNDIIGAMPGVLQLAAAGQLDLARAADLTSNILTGYGMTTEDLARVNDVLAKAFTSANVDLEMLGQSMKYVGPVANSLGVPFEETAAAIALLGNAGIQGTMAGTALRGAMSRLVNPTKENAKLIEELGLSVFDAEGKFVGLTGIVEQLEASGADTAQMMALFGDRAGPAMASLVEQGSAALRELNQDLVDSGGTADRIATVQLRGLKGALTIMKSALEDVFITVGNLVLPYAERFAGAMSRLANRISALPEPVLKFAVVLGGVLAVLGPLLLGIGKAIAIMGFFATPVGWAVLAVMALTAAISAGVLWWDKIVERVPQAATVLEAARTVLDALQTAFGNVSEAVRELIETRDLGAFAGRVLEGLSAIKDGLAEVDWAGIGSTALDLLVSGLSATAGGAARVAGWLGDLFNDIPWGSVGSTLLDGLWGAVETSSGVALRVGGWLGGLFADIPWSSASGKVVDGLWSAVETSTGVAARVGGWVSGLFGSVPWGDTATSLLDGLWGAIETAGGYAARAGGWIAGLFTSVPWADTATSLLDGLWGAIEMAGGYATRAGDWLVGLFTSIPWGDTADALVEGLLTAWETVTGYGGRVADWLAGQLAEVDWSGAAGAVVDGIGTGITSAGTLAETLANKLGEALSEADWAGPAQPIVEGLGGALQSVSWESITGGIATGLGAIQTAAETLWAAIRPAVDTMLPNLTQAWDDIRDSVSSASPLMAALRDLWVSLQPALAAAEPLLKAVAVAIGALWVLNIGLAVGALGGLIGLLTGALPGAIQAATGAVMVLTGIIQTITAVVQGVVQIVSALFRGEWGEAWQAAKGMVADVAKGITTIINGLVMQVQGAISLLVGGVTGMISGFVNAIIGFFQGLYDALVGHSIIPDLINGIVEWFSGLPGKIIGIVAGMIVDLLVAIGGFVADALSAVGTFVADMVVKFVELYTGAMEWFGAIVTDVLSKIGGLVTDLITKAGEIITGFVGGIRDGVADVLGVMGEIAQAVIDGIPNPGDLLKAAAGAIIDGLVSGLGAGKDAVVGAAKSVGGWIKDHKGPIEEDRKMLRPAAAAIIEGLVDGLLAGRAAVAAAAAALAVAIEDGIAVDERGPEIVAQWGNLLNNLSGILDGSVQGKLGQTLRDLERRLQFALSAGAPEEVIAALHEQIAGVTGELELATAAYGQAFEAGLVGSLDHIDLDSVAARYGQMLDGTLQPKLQSELDRLNKLIAFATAQGWSVEMIAAYQLQADDVAAQLAVANETLMVAGAAGLLSDEALAAYHNAIGHVTQIPLDAVQELLPKLHDGGLSMVGQITDGVMGGAVDFESAMTAIVSIAGSGLGELKLNAKDGAQAVISEIAKIEQKLMVDLASALVDGTDPSGIEANIDAIRALLAALQEEIAATVSAGETMYMGSFSGGGPGTSMVAKAAVMTAGGVTSNATVPASSGAGGGGGYHQGGPPVWSPTIIINTQDRNPATLAHHVQEVAEELARQYAYEGGA